MEGTVGGVGAKVNGSIGLGCIVRVEDGYPKWIDLFAYADVRLPERIERFEDEVRNV